MKTGTDSRKSRLRFLTKPSCHVITPWGFVTWNVKLIQHGGFGGIQHRPLHRQTTNSCDSQRRCLIWLLV